MGEIHGLFFLALALVWFAGATPERKVLAKRPFLQAKRALFETSFKLGWVCFSTPDCIREPVTECTSQSSPGASLRAPLRVPFCSQSCGPGCPQLFWERKEQILVGISAPKKKNLAPPPNSPQTPSQPLASTSPPTRPGAPPPGIFN